MESGRITRLEYFGVSFSTLIPRSLWKGVLACLRRWEALLNSSERQFLSGQRRIQLARRHVAFSEGQSLYKSL